MLLEGVKYQDNAFVFDFYVDGEKEIVKLTEDVKRSSIYERLCPPKRDLTHHKKKPILYTVC